MIEAESLIAADQPMIAEQATCCVADQHIRMGSCGFDLFLAKYFADAPEQRTAARDAYGLFGNFLPAH